MKILLRCVLVLLVFVFATFWYASIHPTSYAASLVAAGKSHARAGFGFLSLTRGLDGHWQTRDAGDPKFDLNLNFGIHTCAVTEHIPGATPRETKFTDQRNPPFENGYAILTDGDRYLTVTRSGTVILEVPDGPGTPFIDSAGREQHRQKQKTIHLAKAP